MRLTVLGKSPAWQDADGACSGYLIEDGRTVLLLDCGSGVFAKLRAVRDYLDVDAVLISHLHADHILDLVPFSYGLLISPRRRQHAFAPGQSGAKNRSRPRLIAPSGAGETLERLTGSWGSEGLVADAFAIEEYGADSVVSVDALEARFRRVPHHVTSHAVNLTSPNGGRLTYSSDCRPSEELVEAARDTDLLLVEATVPEPEPDGARGHLTPAEAGEHARRAGARRVVLTHISDELDTEWAVEQASEAFGGPVEIARQGETYVI
jgi:ribonuclease BN (tRNA processing enzyme)